jgi:hypothetical protein
LLEAALREVRISGDHKPELLTFVDSVPTRRCAATLRRLYDVPSLEDRDGRRPSDPRYGNSTHSTVAMIRVCEQAECLQRGLEGDNVLMVPSTMLSNVLNLATIQGHSEEINTHVTTVENAPSCLYLGSCYDDAFFARPEFWWIITLAKIWLAITFVVLTSIIILEFSSMSSSDWNWQAKNYRVQAPYQAEGEASKAQRGNVSTSVHSTKKLSTIAGL